MSEQPHNRHHEWDKKLRFLDYEYNLDWLDTSIWNTNRLPKFILFRQVVWPSGLGEPFYQMSVPGGIGSNISPHHIATIYAEDSAYIWTVVEVGWYDDQPGPYVHDITVYKPDGTYEDSAMRERAARLAAKEAAT